MTINEILTDALKVTIIACLPILLAIISAVALYIKTYIDTHTRNMFIKLISDEAYEVVNALTQTMSGPLKLASADGKLTDTERQTLKVTAIKALESRLKAIPAGMFAPDDLAKRISDSIESSIAQSKTPGLLSSAILAEADKPAGPA